MSDSTEEELLDLLAPLPSEPLTISEIVSETRWSRRTTRDKLDTLVDRELLKTKKVGESTRVWWRSTREGERDEGPERGTTDDGIVEERGEQKLHQANEQGYTQQRESEETLISKLATMRELQAISTQLIQEGDIDVLYDEVVDAAVTIMDADFGSLQLCNADRDYLRLLAHQKLDSESAEFWEHIDPESNTICNAALDTGDRIIVSDIEACEFMTDTADREMYLQTGIRAGQSTPLVSHSGDVLGILSTHWETPHEPSEHNLRLLDVLARQAADLIEHRRSEEMLRENRELLAGQKRVLERLAGGWRLNDVLDDLLRVIENYSDGVRGSILVRHPEEEQFEMAVAPNLPDSYTEKLQNAPITPPYLGPCGKATHAGETVVCGDIETDTRWSSDWCNLVLEYGLHRCHSTPIVGSDDEVIGSFGLYSSRTGDALPDQEVLDAVSDIAAVAIEHTRTEEELRKREERLRAFVTTSSDVVYRMSPDWTEMYHLHGQDFIPDTDEPTSSWGDAYIPPDEQQRVEEAIDEAIRTKSTFELEHQVLQVDDSRGWILSRAVPITDDDGEIVEWFGTAKDITERKERKVELERALDLLKKTERIADVGGWEIDPETLDVFWSDHIFELLKVPGDEEPPLDEALDMYNEEDQPIVEGAVEEALDWGEPFDIEVRIQTGRGDTRWLRLQGVPETDGDEVVSLRGAAHDITRHKEREQRLEELIEQLETSNERLEQFAYAASHDLQEPLRMVSSYLQLIEQRYEDDLDEDGQEFLDYAVDGADRMRGMVDGLLAYSRVETRGNQLGPVDLDDVFEDVRENLQVRIEESDAEITVEDLPRVKGDAGQLRQAFQNLLENAIEYSGDGQPRIHVAAERDGTEWVLSVQDEGIGIEPDQQSQIFEVFKRLHSREEHPGTGIGLALCERIIERHGGRIWVESEPGEGSTFLFTLSSVSDHEN